MKDLGALPESLARRLGGPLLAVRVVRGREVHCRVAPGDVQVGERHGPELLARVTVMRDSRVVRVQLDDDGTDHQGSDDGEQHVEGISDRAASGIRVALDLVDRARAR